MVDLFQRLISTSAGVVYLDVRSDGTIAEANRAFAQYVGVPLDAAISRPLSTFLVCSELERFQRWMGGEAPPVDPIRVNFADVDGAPFSLRCLLHGSTEGVRLVGEAELQDDRNAAVELVRLNNELATMARESRRRERETERTQRELKSVHEELRTSYWHLQKIQEVMPLCMGCGKIKTDELEWQTVVEYLRKNEIFLSHGYCPACADAFLAEHELDDDEEPV